MLIVKSTKFTDTVTPSYVTIAEKPSQIKLLANDEKPWIFVTSEKICFTIPCTTLDGAKSFYKELLLNWDNPCAILTEDGDLISIENFEI